VLYGPADFIIDGAEKVLLTQEALAANVMHVKKFTQELDDDKDSKFEAFAEVKSGSEDGKYPLDTLPRRSTNMEFTSLGKSFFESF
jgi:DNA-directed RNA polymerase beta subunit